MKILMFGRGPIATIYGWVLEQAGHDVEFYVRPGRAAQYGDTIELDLLDTRQRAWGKRMLQSWPVRYRETLEPDHDFDLIVLSVAHYRLAEAGEFLAPRVGDATVLVFGNIWNEPLAAIGDLPPDRVAWGFPLGGGGFNADGALFGALLPSVIFGTLGLPPSERERAVRRVFREAGLRLREEPDIRAWLWIHFIADAGVHSQGLRLGTLAQLAGSRRGWRDALRTTRELLPLLEARGVQLQQYRSSVLLYRAPTWLTAPTLAAASGLIPLAARSLKGHTDPEAEEPRAVCRDTLAEARRLGVAAPRLEAAEPLFALAERGTTETAAEPGPA